MEHFPSALIIASYDSVCHDNNVLYRLVRPLRDGIGVQSTDRLVNVVPFRRKYTFEKKQQLDEFAQQILRRPLVLQPVLHFGRGLGQNCALCYQDELWLVMVNQTNPKILSRLQMGLDSAKGALERGQPFEIKFRFGKVIQRVYREHLVQKERGEAQKSSSTFSEWMTYFRYAEWEHCELNLRYHGYGANLNRSSALHSLPNLEMKWDFEDIGMHEMEWNQSNGQIYPQPHLSPVYDDEIRELLPGWTINSVSPLENIGDSIPENNYDYVQAGRLYASFRKKRQPRDKLYTVPVPSSYTDGYDDDRYQGYSPHEQLEGAVGFDPSVYPDFVDPDHDADECDFGYHDADPNVPLSQSRQRSVDIGSPSNGSDFHYQNIRPSLDQHLPPNLSVAFSSSGARSQPASSTHYTKSQSYNQPKSLQTESQPKYGPVNANVKIISNASLHHYQTETPNGTARDVELHSGTYDALSPSSSDYHQYAELFKEQDSDRFSRSTNADSGYCPDGDDNHSRGGSYDYSDQSYKPRLKQNRQDYENVPRKSGARDGDGLENPAFRYDYHDMNSGLQKQKQLETKPIKDSSEGHKAKSSTGLVYDHTLDYRNQGHQSHHALSPKDSVGNVIKVPPRRKKVDSGSTAVSQVAESFI